MHFRLTVSILRFQPNTDFQILGQFALYSYGTGSGAGGGAGGYLNLWNFMKPVVPDHPIDCLTQLTGNLPFVCSYPLENPPYGVGNCRIINPILDIAN